MRRARFITAFVFAVLFAILVTGGGSASAALVEGDEVVSPVAYTPCVSGARLAYIDWAQGARILRVRDLADGRTFTVPDQQGPRWRPTIDGTRIVFEDYTGGQGGQPALALYDLATEKVERLTEDVAGHYSPSISGDRVAYERRLLHGIGTVVLLDLRTGQERIPVEREADMSDPAIAGDRLVWVERDADGSSIYTMSLAEGRVTTVAAEPGWNDTPSIYGDVVTYCRWPKKQGKGLGELWAFDLKTGGREQLTDGLPACSSPSLSTDTLVWESYDGHLGQPHIYAASVELQSIAARSGRKASAHAPIVRQVARRTAPIPPAEGLEAWVSGLRRMVSPWVTADLLGIWAAAAMRPL